MSNDLSNKVCKNCGSARVRSRSAGFNLWCLLWWLLTLVTALAGLLPATLLFFCFAIFKTIAAPFQRADFCGECKSGDILPADSPLGRKLAAELRAE
jgi:hypothetical protein